MDGAGDAEITFNASKDNSIYSGNVLQPASVQVLMIIKVWIAGIWKPVPEYKALDLLALNEMLDAPSPSMRLIFRACRVFQYSAPFSITSSVAEYDWDTEPLMFGNCASR